MQYRDIEINIVRMSAPGGWKWTFTNDGKESSGSRPDREDAIQLAKKFIDGRLGRRKPRFDLLGSEQQG
jgi:hypothetical protein